MNTTVKRLFAVLLAMLMCFALIAACGGQTDTDTPADTANPPSSTSPPSLDETPPPPDTSYMDALLAQFPMDENRRFIDPVPLSILVWDRNDNGPGPDYDFLDNAYTDYIREGMLRDHNIVVEFVGGVNRWSEGNDIMLLLAEGAAPDASFTWDINLIQDFADQGAVVDLAPILYNSEELFPHMWELLGREFIYKNQNRETGAVFGIEGRLVDADVKYLTFIREDWLDKLGMNLPTNLEEFEACLIAFRDNAELLLGSDASNMVPMGMTSDIAWDAAALIESYIPDGITDKEWYVTAICETGRNFFRPGVKEAIRVLNRWYNEGLLHPDFALFKPTDDQSRNLIRAGWVGATMGNFDMHYRGGDESYTAHMQNTVGPEANYIAVDTFPNDAGIYRKYVGVPNDRKMFVPSTCENPLAALLFWDWQCNRENLEFLQIGMEGINHEVLENGSISMLAEIDNNSRYFIPSIRNNDIVPVINGLWLKDPDVTARSWATQYDVDLRLIDAAWASQLNGIRRMPDAGLPNNMDEVRIGDTVREQMEAAWSQAIYASVSDFDSVYDREVQVIYDAYATEFMAWRTENWETFYGDAVSLVVE